MNISRGFPVEFRASTEAESVGLGWWFSISNARHSMLDHNPPIRFWTSLLAINDETRSQAIRRTVLC